MEKEPVTPEMLPASTASPSRWRRLVGWFRTMGGSDRRLSPEDHACLTDEGASDDEIGWIDAWLRARPGRTLEVLKEQEDRLVTQLRLYRDLLDERVKSGPVGAEPGQQVREGRKTVIAALSQIDRDVLSHGLQEVSAAEKMSPTDKTIVVGLIREALASRRRKR